MTPLQFLNVSRAFLNGQKGTFSSLITKGLVAANWSERDLALEMVVIPSTISLWSAGTVKPSAGMQRVALMKLRRQALQGIK